MNNNELYEARARAELNPQLSAYEQLKPFKDDPSIYISFTSIEKLGIHPSGDDGGTPLGIYAFPLKETWVKYEVDRHKNFERYPVIAQGRPHIQIFRWSGKPKIIDGLNTYTANQLAKDIKKLKESFGADVDSAVETVRRDYAGKLTPFKEMYYVARNLADTYPNQWNHILRYLGYTAIIDHGTKTIHYAEPYQALFLTSDAVHRIGSIYSKSYEGGEHLKKYDPRGLTVSQMTMIAYDNNRRIKKFEPYIMKSPKWAMDYIENVMKFQPWLEAEPYIMKDSKSATAYALNVLRKRWKVAEPYMNRSSDGWLIYKRRYLKDVPPEDIPAPHI